MDGSPSWSQCLAWISSETQQELKSLQISFSLWDLSLWFCLRAFNSPSESNLHLYPSLCSCCFHCGWVWTRGAHTGFDDNWKIIIIWVLILCFRENMSRTGSSNYKHISCLPPFFLQKRWGHPFCPCSPSADSQQPPFPSEQGKGHSLQMPPEGSRIGTSLSCEWHWVTERQLLTRIYFSLKTP